MTYDPSKCKSSIIIVYMQWTSFTFVLRFCTRDQYVANLYIIGRNKTVSLEEAVLSVRFMKILCYNYQLDNHYRWSYITSCKEEVGQLITIIAQNYNLYTAYISIKSISFSLNQLVFYLGYRFSISNWDYLSFTTNSYVFGVV